MRFSRPFFSLLLPLLIILIIVLACFGRTLGSFFLADDIGELSYVSKIFAGNWQLVAANFSGNYMSVPTMKVYRPCLLLSLMFDYGIWKTNACGYFITNIFFLTAAAMMLYMVLRELTRSWTEPRSIIFALSSAALFACSPLHCESVSLVVGRVDIICAFFYLLSLWIFLHKGNRHGPVLLIFGLVSFWIALLTKEMAIGLPVVLTAICLLLPDVLTKQSNVAGIFTGAELKENITQRFKSILYLTAPVWLSCVVYLCIRRLILGTFLGGYVGGVGASQFSHILEKWTDLDTVWRIVFPLNSAVFGDNCIYKSWLIGLYLAILALAIFKILNQGILRAWLALLIIWIAIALVPIYQLWGLGFNLEGARFLFFLTIPASVVLPLLIFAPKRSDRSNTAAFGTTEKAKANLYIHIAGTLALIALVGLETKITQKNNVPWVHAGKQTKSLLLEGQKLARSINPGQKVIILGIPDQIEGAHVIYNGITFNCLMSPPFSQQKLDDRFILFEPILYGKGEAVNSQRLKEELLRSDLVGFYLWQQDKRAFEKRDMPFSKQLAEVAETVSFPLPSQGNMIFPFTRQRGNWEPHADYTKIVQGEKGIGMSIGPLDVNPFSYDYLEVEADIDPPPNLRQMGIFWQGNASRGEPWAERHGQVLSCQPAALSAQNGSDTADNKLAKSQIYRFALSQYWRWFTEGTVNHVWLEFPPAKSIVIKNFRLIAGPHLLPKLSILDMSTDNTGVYAIDKRGLTIQIEAQQVDNCAMVKLEFSKPNYFFENLDAEAADGLLTSTTINGCSTKCSIGLEHFPVPGYYQIRAICLNKNGTRIGEWSDPLTVKI